MESATRNGTSRGVQHWIEGARVLSEEGRLAWLLGQGLQEALEELSEGNPEEPAAVTARLQTWVKAASGTTLPSAEKTVPKVRPKRRSTGSQSVNGDPKRKDSSFSWSQASRRRLDDRSYPVIFVGARQVRRAWVSLALGVDLNGNKHVLGGRDDAEAGMLPADLAARGLVGDDGLLVITDGSRRLDDAVRRTWRGRAQVQHCLYRLRHDLRAHAPAQEHPGIERTLKVAGTCPVDEAQEALKTLCDQLRGPHPSAAARLERSLDSALTVVRLGVGGRLREHLQVQGMLRVACTQATREGSASAAGLKAIASGLGAWIERTRRFIDRERLPDLAERLRRASQEGGRPDAKKA